MAPREMDMTRHMDLVKRNAEIVALVKARKMPMRKVAARYRLSTSSISLIAIKHGVHAQAADPKKVRAASKLMARGMPLTHVADTVGLTRQRLRQILAKKGLYRVRPPNGRPWSKREVRILRRDYGKLGNSASTIAAKLGRTPNQITSIAAYLGLNWPLEFRAWENVGGKPKLTARQQAEALRRLKKAILPGRSRATSTCAIRLLCI
jgi:hypothetical protein